MLLPPDDVAAVHINDCSQIYEAFFYGNVHDVLFPHMVALVYLQTVQQVWELPVISKSEHELSLRRKKK